MLYDRAFPGRGEVRFLRYSIALFAILFLGHRTEGRPADGRPWDLQDCFRYALDHNIQINTLRLDERSALQDLSAAKGMRIPLLSASAGTSLANGGNTVNANDTIGKQLTNSGSYSLNSSVVLWNGNAVQNTVRERALQVRSAGLSVEQSRNDIFLQIAQAYLSVLLSKENLKYVAELVDNSAASVKQGQQLYDAGSIAKVALLQLQAQSASDRYLKVQAENAIRQNLLSLKQLLQLPTDTAFDVLVPDTIVTEMPLTPLGDVQEAALRDFPDSKIGELSVHIASVEIAKAKAAFMPTLSANGAVGSGYLDVLRNSAYPNTGYFAQTGNNFYQTLGLGLSVPIFSQKINRANLEKAKIAYAQSRLGLDNIKLVLSQAVEQAYLDALNAMQSLDAASEQLRSASESYRVGNEQLRLGAINAYDLLQQRNQYVQAFQAYVQAKYATVLQQKIYEFYRGKPITL